MHAQVPFRFVFVVALWLLAAASHAQTEGYVADIQLQSTEEFAQLLSRADALVQSGEVPLDGQPRVTFVMHGPGVRSLLRPAYLENKSVVDLAARLSALGVIEIRACETWMGGNAIDPSELQPFVGTVASGRIEVERLVSERGYVKF